MQCPRLNHFARINYDGTVSRCGHMVSAPKFESVSAMDNSEWLKSTALSMESGTWPRECERCKTSEDAGQQSIRHHSIKLHKQLYTENNDYLIVGGVLDNICNSGCQSCNAQHSTKLGALEKRDYIQINNESAFNKLPLDRIIKLDINGGEPTASPAYQRLLENLPPNVKYLRVNTNGSRVLPNLQNIIDRGVEVTITVSLDGIGNVHDYVRWPIKWDTVHQTIQAYKKFKLHELNTWTTVHALNIGDLQNIIDYTTENNIKHSWALLDSPDVLNVKYSNHFTRTAKVPEYLKSIVGSGTDNTVELQLWTYKQDSLRGIKLWDYYK